MRGGGGREGGAGWRSHAGRGGGARPVQPRLASQTRRVDGGCPGKATRQAWWQHTAVLHSLLTRGSRPHFFGMLFRGACDGPPLVLQCMGAGRTWMMPPQARGQPAKVARRRRTAPISEHESSLIDAVPSRAYMWGRGGGERAPGAGE
eukprot:352386-Chlamydomonas_euryale.AAC.9